MSKKAKGKVDPLAKLFSTLKPTAAEWAKLREKETDPKEHARLEALLDRKYKAPSADRLEVDPKVLNTGAFILKSGHTKDGSLPRIASSLSILWQLFEDERVKCDCVVPFKFKELRVFDALTGPEETTVDRGIIGAFRWGPNEYTVFNPGDTVGTTRVPVNGQMHLVFEALLPQAGRWTLLMPTGTLLLKGSSRVIGHGNSTTSYDAKVRVSFFEVLTAGNNLVELNGGLIHSDGTRSEDRTRFFDGDSIMAPRYVQFNGGAGDAVTLSLRVEIETEANEDGLATGVIDEFGFLANSTQDYDTMVIKAP